MTGLELIAVVKAAARCRSVAFETTAPNCVEVSAYLPEGADRIIERRAIEHALAQHGPIGVVFTVIAIPLVLP